MRPCQTLFSFFGIFWLLMALASLVVAGDAVKEVVGFDPVDKNLLLPDGFRAYESGFDVQEGVFVCDNGSNENSKRGVAQSVTLNQKRPEPILAELWSCAENVSGTPNGDYGIYIDLLYDDGTPLWGQTVAFATGTHNWQKKTLMILPDKPVKSLVFYAMFRNKSGKVFFRDMKLTTLPFPENGCLFDGMPVVPRAKSQYQIRDVAANSHFYSLQDNPLGISVSLEEQGALTKITLANREKSDRCLTLVYAIDVPAEGLKWCESPRTNVDVAPNTEYVSASFSPNVGSSGRLSLYPFAAVAGEKGTGIGIDMHKPAFFRAGYHSGTSELYLAVDVALTEESPEAVLHFVRFSFDPKDTFRGALAAYYELFPSYFESRTPEQGVWMPFASISKVPNHEDFGFKFKEGNNEIAWDDTHDIITFRYTEPMTWWMTIPQDLPQTYEVALEHAKKLADAGDPMAVAFFRCGMHDSEGKFVCQLLDTPWCKGAVWSMNDMPDLEGGSFPQRWSPKIYERLYLQNERGNLDGEYIDSMEGYVTAELDFNRAHFSAAKTPLVFSREDHVPAIFRGLVVFEYTRRISEDMHSQGKLMMGNSTPDRLCWLAPWLDVMGTETNWNHNNRWSPMSDSQMLYRRSLCGSKPYCFLMNTDFSKFSYDMSERFMMRSLAYGMFPGYFSADASTGHYFSRPELYERDRSLFKKYIPLCKLLAEAGWQPLTLATSNDPEVYVERFGPDPAKSRYTVFNDSQKEKTVQLRFQQQYDQFKDLVSDKTEMVEQGTLQLRLSPESVVLLEPVADP